MSTSFFRFYAELNDFLMPVNRQLTIPYHFKNPPSVKDAIEALGVPHPEVALILTGDQSVSFKHRLNPDERIAVYPHFRQIKSDTVNKLRPSLSGEPKFLTDQNLGKLTKKLRLLGLDTTSFSTNDPQKFIQLANTEKRIILTRSVRLLKYKSIIYGYWVRFEDVFHQVQEILNRFRLKEYLKPFRRCSVCNGLVYSVKKEEISERLPSNTSRYFADFDRCANCGRIYWKGAHYQRIKVFFDQVVPKPFSQRF